MLHKSTSHCKMLIVAEEGWSGQPKYSTLLLFHVKPIRSLLIQRAPAGSSSRFLVETFDSPLLGLAKSVYYFMYGY